MADNENVAAQVEIIQALLTEKREDNANGAEPALKNKYVFDFRKVSAKERRKLLRDILRSETSDDGDLLLLPWLGKTHVGEWADGKDYSDVKVFEAADAVEFNEVLRAFLRTFRTSFN